MGAKKPKATAKKSGIVGKAKSALGALKGGKSKGAGGRRRRETVTSLQNKILKLKLKKRLMKLKYGGRI